MNVFDSGNWRILAYLMICTLGQVARAAPNPYGIYTLYSQGSGRVMAMGGTFAATSDDAAGIVLNPAGPALEKWTFDAGGSNNRVDDHGKITKTTNYLSTTARDVSPEPYSYLFYSAAGRAGPIVFGAGYSTPYEYFASDSNSFHTGQLKITSYDAMLASRFGEMFAIGVAGHYSILYEMFEQSANFGNAPYRGETSSYSTWFSAGACFRDKKGSLGIAYSQEHTFTVDTEKNDPSLSYTWFRDVIVPASTTFGGAFRINDKLLFALDMSFVDVPKNAVDILSGFNGPVNVPLKTGTQQVLHGGFEYVVTKERHMNFVFRGGLYDEASRLRDGDSRLHRTFGLQVRFGPVVLNVSFDQAADFNNTSQGFSLMLGAI